jgi:23S rRNA (guanine1835-N2)-methyltransferase
VSKGKPAASSDGSSGGIGGGIGGTDAADDYLLQHLAQTGVDLGGSVVVLGDRTGELTAALTRPAGPAGLTEPATQVGRPCHPTLISDSFLALASARDRLRADARSDAATLSTTGDEPPPRIDVLLIRVPKSLALLEDQLHRLAPRLHADSVVVATGKAVEIHTSTLRLFERIVGPTRTSLAQRKARLVFSEPDPALARPRNPWPLRYPLPVDKELGPVAGREVTNHAGVFCADRLDIGTRFLLEHLPRHAGAEHVVDLGCGNGVVGLAAALLNPGARVTFVDESYPAIESARATFAANVAPPRAAEARFRAGDALDGVPDASADLVLNNPPFHSHRATTDAVAWRMFTGARRVLRPGGQLWVVGNRHLGYHVKLRRVFGNCDTVAGNPKFVILRAIKR